MLVILHIFIATLTILLSVYTALRPSKTLIQNSKYSAAATLFSGVLLLTQPQVSVARACISGIAITALSYMLISIAAKKYAYESVIK